MKMTIMKMVTEDDNDDEDDDDNDDEDDVVNDDDDDEDEEADRAAAVDRYTDRSTRILQYLVCFNISVFVSFERVFVSNIIPDMKGPVGQC